MNSSNKRMTFLLTCFDIAQSHLIFWSMACIQTSDLPIPFQIRFHLYLILWMHLVFQLSENRQTVISKCQDFICRTKEKPFKKKNQIRKKWKEQGDEIKKGNNRKKDSVKRDGKRMFFLICGRSLVMTDRINSPICSSKGLWLETSSGRYSISSSSPHTPKLAQMLLSNFNRAIRGIYVYNTYYIA